LLDHSGSLPPFGDTRIGAPGPGNGRTHTSGDPVESEEYAIQRPSVRWLEIAMDDALFVRSLECRRNLLRDRVAHRHGTARDAFGERFALDQFEDESAHARAGVAWASSKP
jgi:hypothetical protein